MTYTGMARLAVIAAKVITGGAEPPSVSDLANAFVHTARTRPCTRNLVTPDLNQFDDLPLSPLLTPDRRHGPLPDAGGRLRSS